MTTPVETCTACRFDGAQYNAEDTRGTLRALGPMWRQTTEGQPDAVLDARPAPDVWSATEYAVHTTGVVATLTDLLRRALDGQDRVLPAKPEQPAPDPSIGFAAAVDGLHAAFLAAHDLVLHRHGRAKEWAATVVLGDRELDAAWLVRHLVHEGSHHLSDVGRGLHLLGAGAPSQAGVVAQLNTSDGGVPKRPVEAAEVSDRGLVGDRQASRKHHGRPLQALCLWSAEVIDALQAEGHPIAPGAAGENITVRGIDWSTIRPGTQLLVGDVLAEISAWAVPCKKNAPWFTDGDFNRMLHDRHPGWSRAYAWVCGPGTIHQGDAVVVEP